MNLPDDTETITFTRDELHAYLNEGELFTSLDDILGRAETAFNNKEKDEIYVVLKITNNETE